MATINKITDDEVNNLLSWDKVIPLMKQVMISITNQRSKNNDTHESKPSENELSSFISQRSFTPVTSGDGFLLCMPGYVQGLDLGNENRESALSCKLITVFPKNSTKSPPLPAIDGIVVLFDTKTGKLNSIMDADQITQWRTAAVSCVGAKILLGDRQYQDGKVLALIGAGVQGRIHALAFTNQFRFNEIKIWNRTLSRAHSLVSELKSMGVTNVHVSQTPQECVEGADVIVTTTSAAKPIVENLWVKNGAVVCAIGVGKETELSPEIYKRSQVYVESRESASKEIPHLNVEAELGELVLGMSPSPLHTKIAIFQSLGIGVEDTAVASLVYNLKMQPKKVE